MEEILKILSRLYKLKLTSHLKEQQVFNTHVISLTVTKAVMFPKLSEIYCF